MRVAYWPFALAVTTLIAFSVPQGFAHLGELPHYNAIQRGVENYVIQQALDPEYAPPVSSPP